MELIYAIVSVLAIIGYLLTKPKRKSGSIDTIKNVKWWTR